MAERTNEELQQYQRRLKYLLKKKRKIDEDMKEINRKMTAIHNNRLEIT